MEIINKIKKIPKKRLIIVCLLIVLVIATLTVTFIAAKRSLDSSSAGNEGNSGADDDTLAVFKPSAESTDKSSTADTVEPIDVSGINGLKYVSLGNGSCYIDGIGTCTDTELKIPAYSPYGDKVIKINDGAFTNCTSLVSVSIPATVKTIGTGVFRGCSSLVAINVDTENSVYCSVGGVLLSKDKTVLVCIPMDRPNESYLINKDTKAIAAYAFEGVLNLKKILYEGKVSEFQEIDILMGNDIIDTVTITCNYVSGK